MSKQKTLINDMTSGSVLRQLIVFAIPLILANILQTLYNTVDMIVVGQFVGSSGLSAVSVGGEVQHFFTNLCMGFSAGGQIIISQQVGMGDRDGIRKTIGTLFTCLFSVSIVCTIVGLCLVPQLLDLMNTPPEAYSQARDYVIVTCIGMPFIFGYNCISSVMRGMGDSRRPLMFIAISSVVNLMLDLLLVALIPLQALGAAIATVVGQGVSVVVSLVYLYRRREAFGFDFRLKSFAVDRDKLMALLRVGTPLAVQHTAINLSLIYVNSNINAYGVTASATLAVGNKIQQMSNILTNGLNTAGGAMIGQNLGARKIDRAKRIVYIALAVSLTLCAINVALALTIPRQLFSLFTTDEAVLDMAAYYMNIYFWAFIGSALMGPFGAMVTGSGFSTLGLAVGIMDGVVARLGLSFILCNMLGMGLDGYLYANSMARFAAAAVQMTYFYSGKWKTRRLVVEKEE